MDLMEQDVERGIEEAYLYITHLLRHNYTPVIVQIAGGTGSGKTTMVAKRLIDKLGKNVTQISTDDYFKGAAFLEREKKKKNTKVNADHPDYVDLAQLAKNLKALRKGKKIMKPVYNMKLRKRTGYKSLSPKKVIILEGTFALHDELHESGDLKIFVEASKEDRYNRRLKRMGKGRMMETNLRSYFVDVIEPMHKKHVLPTKKRADIVIRN